MQQHYIDDIINPNDYIILNNDILYHFNKVLRYKDNQEFYLLDKNSNKYLCKLINNKAKIIKSITTNSELPIKVTIIQALLKNQNFDYLIQKAIELGVYQIIPLYTNRTIIKDNNKDKTIRYNKIALSSANQCKRNMIPKVLEPININDIKNYKSSINLIAYEQPQINNLSIKEYINNQDITIVIGPEGGFEQYEIDTLVKENFNIVNFGDRILRSETSSLYFLSCVNILLEKKL